MPTPMNFLHINMQSFVRYLKSQHQKGNRKVAKLHQLAPHQKQHTDNQPQNILDQFLPTIHDNSHHEVEAQGIDQAHGVLQQLKVSINVEDIVAIIGEDEWMHHCEFIHHEQAGC